jgi:hypothetical protein
MRCGPGTVEAAGLVHRRSTSCRCRGEHELAEMLQMSMTTPVRSQQPLSLIQDGADEVSPTKGLCSTSVDKRDKHDCSLLVQNSLL